MPLTLNFRSAASFLGPPVLADDCLDDAVFAPEATPSARSRSIDEAKTKFVWGRPRDVRRAPGELELRLELEVEDANDGLAESDADALRNGAAPLPSALIDDEAGVVVAVLLRRAMEAASPAALRPRLAAVDFVNRDVPESGISPADEGLADCGSVGVLIVVVFVVLRRAFVAVFEGREEVDDFGVVSVEADMCGEAWDSLSVRRSATSSSA